MFASHGFQNLVERVKLGKFLFQKTTNENLHQLSTPERLRLSFEQLGPSFVKFGQLLASRPDLTPKEFIVEFEKLQDNVRTVAFDEIRQVVEDELEKDLFSIFQSFDKTPLGSASIAQVHRAKLLNGNDVVVKVQRPGIIDTINNDLVILYNLAQLLETYIPELRVYNPVGVVDEFFKSLELETNFIVEANNIQKVTHNFRNDPSLKIPQVYSQYTTEKILVMEELKGVRLSQANSLKQEGVVPEEIARLGLGYFFQMVFRDGLFHGDLHAGNIFVLPNNKIGLVDFGVVGRLSHKMRFSIASMMLALSNEDYEQLAYEFVDIAPYTEKVQIDQFANELRALIAPYFGLTLKNVDLGKILFDATGVAAKFDLQLPTELLLFFKAVVTVEGMGRKLVSDFDLLSFARDFQGEIIKSQLDVDVLKKNITNFGKDINSLLFQLPRQLKQLLRKLNTPEYSRKIHIDGLEDLKHSIESSANILFLGLVIFALILSATAALFVPTTNYIGDLPLLSAIGYSFAGVLSILAFVNYIRKG